MDPLPPQCSPGYGYGQCAPRDAAVVAPAELDRVDDAVALCVVACLAEEVFTWEDLAEVGVACARVLLARFVDDRPMFCVVTGSISAIWRVLAMSSSSVTSRTLCGCWARRTAAAVV